MATLEYSLFPKQDAFVFDEHQFSGYGGGFGNGKTLAGAFKTYFHCMQNKDALFFIGRRHATDLARSTKRDFLSLFGEMGEYRSKQESFVFKKDGKVWSEVLFGHLDDLQSLTNMNLSGFWIDQAEEVSEDAFDFLVGRLRRNVQRREGFITFNMDGHNWIWRRFLKRKDRDGRELRNSADYFLVTATTLENKENLPKDYINALLSQPREYVKRFVEGSWDSFSGQVYSEFSPEIHVLKEGFSIPETWERIRAIDHGQGIGHATVCLWGAVDYNGNIFIYREFFSEQEAVSTNAQSIKEMSKYREYTTGKILDEYYVCTVIDPSTHRKSQSKDGYVYSVADEYMEHGIPTICAQNDVLAGINHVKEYLKLLPEHSHPLYTDEEGKPKRPAPRLYIFPECEHVIEEMGQYKWKQYTATLTGERDTMKEAPLKKNDNAVDCLRYLLMQRPIAPENMQEMEAWVYSDPIELARRAQRLGMTVDDLIANRFSRNSLIRHTPEGARSPISHSSSLHQQ